MRLPRDEIVFGCIVFQRQGNDGLVVKLAIREKSGDLRHETLAYKRKPL